MSLTFVFAPVRAILTMLTAKWIIRNPWFLEKIGNRFNKFRTRTLKNYEQVEYGTQGPDSTEKSQENIIITDNLEAYRVICNKDGSKTFQFGHKESPIDILKEKHSAKQVESEFLNKD